MKTVTAEQMRELDRRTIEDFGTPGEVLMERAGQGIADSIIRRSGWLGGRFRGVIAVAGRGNNGGDACVAARILMQAGIPVELWAATATSAYSGDAEIHFKRMVASGVTVRELALPQDWSDPSLDCAGKIIVDGILGTGARGAARGAAGAAVEWITRMSPSNSVLAIDVPSGLNADSGKPEGPVVTADWTVTMALPKTGLIEQSAREYVGNLEVVDIGIPAEFIAELGEGVELICGHAMHELMPRREASSHKGSHGSALLIAGSAKFPGAAVLCAMGAVRSGAGLVTVLTADTAVAAVASAVPEAIVRGVPVNDDGAMDFEAVVAAVEDLPSYNSVVVGPGMTDSASTLKIVAWLMANTDCGTVLDADALNVVASNEVKQVVERGDLVLTPHPGEAGRLLQISAADVQADRCSALRNLADKFSGVMVLKGAGTLIAHHGVERINLTGNAGMAKGGSGDVLAGLLGGLIAQRLSPADAAELAVYIHGRAGDIVACRGSMQGMTAGDVAGCIPDAFASLEMGS